MGLAGKIIEYEWAWQGTSYKLFAKDGQIDGLLGGLDPVGAVNPAPQQVGVGGHTRKRYPGGPSISVSGFTRTTLLGGDANRRTLPGQNAYLETTVSTSNGPKKEVVTITFTGPFTALYQFVLANAENEFTLRSPDGTPYEITTTTP
jgi:hypothetical protein